jgi:hypothetical protein
LHWGEHIYILDSLFKIVVNEIDTENHL